MLTKLKHTRLVLLSCLYNIFFVSCVHLYIYMYVFNSPALQLQPLKCVLLHLIKAHFNAHLDLQ